jgi:hypothetical protein
MVFKKMTVTLSNHQNEKYDLEYQIRNTQAAQIWAQSISNAIPDGLHDTDRFYNFPDQNRSDLNYALEKLERILHQLKSLHPELDFPEVDRKNLQYCINNLHYNFAHSHHVTKCINENNVRLWDEFNITLHLIESLVVNKTSLQHLNTPGAQIIFTWKSKHYVPIPESSYQDFTVSLDFGTAYINYAHIGRHFLEMFNAQDVQLADEHIQPHRRISADTNLWFGSTLGRTYEITKMKKIEAWFNEHKDRFNSLGYFWSDPLLAIGRIPVARLIEAKYTALEINSFIENIARFQKVEKVTIC